MSIVVFHFLEKLFYFSFFLDTDVPSECTINLKFVRLGETAVKMKEVCRRSGLTERTVRYYEEQGLLTPARSFQNGRTRYDYSEKNLEQLMTAAVLRKSGFTIAEIRKMIESPKETGHLARECVNRLRCQGEEEIRNAEALAGLDAASFKNAETLVSALKSRAERLSLPRADLVLNFGKDDPETVKEKQEGILSYQARTQSRYRTGKTIVYAIGISNIVLALLILAAGFLSSSPLYGIIGFLLTVIFSVALMCGVKWVYWYYIVTSILSVLQSFFQLFRPEFDPVLFWSAVISLAINLGIVWLLLKSRAVKAFFEEKSW